MRPDPIRAPCPRAFPDRGLLPLARQLCPFRERGDPPGPGLAPAILESDLRVCVPVKLAAMSEGDFDREFRQNIGRTLGQYGTSAQREAACQTLVETRLALNGVAQKIG